jgi:hypothetical protein
VTKDLDRLEIRSAIWQEATELLEYRRALALEDAEYTVSPRVKLVDRPARVVRVVNAPPDARQNPPQLLSHIWWDAYHQKHSDVVGKLHRQSSPRDLDYVLFPISGGDNLLALVADDAAPTVQMRKWTNGHTDLLAYFD